jgi:hypothetical protein
VARQEKGVRMGFLRQDIDFEQGRTVLWRKHTRLCDIKIVEKIRGNQFIGYS